MNFLFFLHKLELELYKFLTACGLPSCSFFYRIQFFSLPVDAAEIKELSTTEFLTNLLAISTTHL